MNEQPFRPVLRTQADVEKFWISICHPLGWRRHDLWAVIVDGSGRPLPVVQDLRDRPVEVDDEVVRGLVEVWRLVRDDLDPQARIAVLLCRPGPDAIVRTDREWAGAITAEAVSAGIPLEVVHLASDVAIRPIPLDDVTMAAGSGSAPRIDP
jgi:hypothetical protein